MAAGGQHQEEPAAAQQDHGGPLNIATDDATDHLVREGPETCDDINNNDDKIVGTGSEHNDILFIHLTLLTLHHAGTV